MVSIDHSLNVVLKYYVRDMSSLSEVGLFQSIHSLLEKWPYPNNGTLILDALRLFLPAISEVES